MRRINTMAAMAAAMLAVSVAYPVTVELHNNTWSRSVEPETSTDVEGYGVAKVTVRDADQMQRVLDNLDALRALNGWAEDTGLFVVLPEPDPVVAEVTPEVIEPPPPDGATEAPPQDPAPSDVAAVTGATEPAAAPAVAATGKKRK
jgi:hypothetical protein